ncbi:MAG: hypothetical protein FJ352_03735 [Firmicutes bacterium]|nr:hypothetical protein [Bacillota bacterium]
MSDQESFDKFTFSMKLAAETGKDISKKVDILDERIDKITTTVLVDDMPIIKAILGVTRSKTDLKKIAKALDRLADIIEIHDSLKNRLTVIEAVQNDSKWFVSSFADFENDIDATIAQLMPPEAT